jgi:hypothetical protein
VAQAQLHPLPGCYEGRVAEDAPVRFRSHQIAAVQVGWSGPATGLVDRWIRVITEFVAQLR